MPQGASGCCFPHLTRFLCWTAQPLPHQITVPHREKCATWRIRGVCSPLPSLFDVWVCLSIITAVSSRRYFEGRCCVTQCFCNSPSQPVYDHSKTPLQPLHRLSTTLHELPVDSPRPLINHFATTPPWVLQGCSMGGQEIFHLLPPSHPLLLPSE